jgi:hypothetical protein
MNQWDMWGSRYQWNFLWGWSNDFDFIRIALSWMDFETAKLRFSLLGFELNISFPARSAWYWRRKFNEWWGPCSDCGKRFGRHDESKAHLPF